jgi:cell cycle arrest protein BUB3
LVFFIFYFRDKTIKLWDLKSLNCVNTFQLPGKVYSMDIRYLFCFYFSPDGNKLVVATSSLNVYIYDVRNSGKILQTRESSLKFQSRILRCSIDNTGKIFFFFFLKIR